MRSELFWQDCKGGFGEKVKEQEQICNHKYFILYAQCEENGRLTVSCMLISMYGIFLDFMSCFCFLFFFLGVAPSHGTRGMKDPDADTALEAE